jgi:hypothetical protein
MVALKSPSKIRQVHDEWWWHFTVENENNSL